MLYVKTLGYDIGRKLGNCILLGGLIRFSVLTNDAFTCVDVSNQIAFPD